MDEQNIIYRLRKRAEIRRNAKDRKSVQEGKNDRVSDLLEEAAKEIEWLRSCLSVAKYQKQESDMIKEDGWGHW